MKKNIIIVIAMLAIISPFIVTYISATPGIKEASFSEVLISTACVIITIFGLYLCYNKFFKKFNGYLFILSDWEDRELCEAISDSLLKYNWKVLPPSLDFYITNTTNKGELTNKYLNLAKGAVIIIGENSKSSPYFNSMMKTIKKSGIRTLCLRTAPNVEIPVLLQRAQIIPVIDTKDISDVSPLIDYFLRVKRL